LPGPLIRSNRKLTPTTVHVGGRVAHGSAFPDPAGRAAEHFFERKRLKW
jgi:hypothetical protein